MPLLVLHRASPPTSQTVIVYIGRAALNYVGAADSSGFLSLFRPGSTKSLCATYVCTLHEIANWGLGKILKFVSAIGRQPWLPCRAEPVSLGPLFWAISSFSNWVEV